MHALSGMGGKNSSHKAENRYQPVEIPLTLLSENRNDSTVVGPTRLTVESGMHSIVMDDNCRYFVDTCSDLGRPTTVKIYELPTDTRLNVKRILTLYDAVQDDKFMPTIKTMTNGKRNESTDLVKNLPPPELLSFPTSDGTATLHAAIYKPDPKIHGPGPYPLVCAVYGGPHVQRVNRSWSQSADMRAQRLRSLGFCVVKCDNRGSSRRGLVFESAIARRLGRLEVLDQVAAVRQLIVRGIADANRVGVYGWSYGGYLSAMCLCRVLVAGAPVTSWDGYDTHYTERYIHGIAEREYRRIDTVNRPSLTTSPICEVG
jgi:dipeptidyl-peptidase-4